MITFDQDIGTVVDQETGAEEVINRGAIDYSSKGTHRVPSGKEGEDE